MADEIDLDQVKVVYAQAFIEEGQLPANRVAAVIAQIEFTIRPLANGEVELEVIGFEGSRTTTGFDEMPGIAELRDEASGQGAADAENFIGTLSLTGIDAEWPTPLITRTTAISPVDASGRVFSLPLDEEFERD